MDASPKYTTLANLGSLLSAFSQERFKVCEKANKTKAFSKVSTSLDLEYLVGG